MRSAQFNEFTGIGALQVEEVPEPVVHADEVLIRVEAVGLNFFDTLLLVNRYQITPSLPYSPGAEIAGTIEQLGDDVRGLRVGQRVMGFIGGNGCKERIAAKAKAIIPIPDGISMEVAAGMPVTYGTALYGLKDRAVLKPGETVVVLGAAGGAGLAAIEIAKLLEARVIAVASSGDKLALCREHGADEGLNYVEHDLKTGLKRLTWGHGIDVIYDCVGGEHAEPALRAIAWDGRYLVIGFASGEIPRIPLNLVLLKGCAIVGVFWSAYVERDPDHYRDDMAQLFGWIEDGKLKPHIYGSFPLEETPRALALIQGRQVRGKVIVRPQD